MNLLRITAALTLFITAASGAFAADAVSEDNAAPEKVKFAWGAEFGSSIDLSAHDMSSIDFDASFGLHYSWLTFAGVGAGANIMVSNSCRTYPIFAEIRTSFSRRPQVVFMDLRGGFALNYLAHDVTQTGGYGSVGIGFNLAGSRKFQSYLIGGYTFVTRHDVMDSTGYQPYGMLSYAGIRLGITF